MNRMSVKQQLTCFSSDKSSFSIDRRKDSCGAAQWIHSHQAFLFVFRLLHLLSSLHFSKQAYVQNKSSLKGKSVPQHKLLTQSRSKIVSVFLPSPLIVVSLSSCHLLFGSVWEASNLWPAEASRGSLALAGSHLSPLYQRGRDQVDQGWQPDRVEGWRTQNREPSAFKLAAGVQWCSGEPKERGGCGSLCDWAGEGVSCGCSQDQGGGGEAVSGRPQGN